MSTLVAHLNNHSDNYSILVKKYATIVVANILIAIAFNVFFIPNHLLSGGVGGLTIMFHYITELPTFMFYILLNIPIFILGFKFIDGEFIFNSFISVGLMSFFLNATNHLNAYVTINDILIEAIIGGVIVGIGLGLLFTNKSSQGGFDIIAVILKKKFNVELKNILFGANLIIISFSGFIFSFREAAYTLIALFISYQVLNKIKEGINPEKNAMIITNKPEEVIQHISKDIKRGTTFVNAKGGYTEHEKTIIYCTLKNAEVVTLKNILNRIDAESFLTISDLNEVNGKGFTKNFI